MLYQNCNVFIAFYINEVIDKNEVKRERGGGNKRNMMIMKFIINIITNLFKRYLTYKMQPKLDKINESTSLSDAKFNIGPAFDVLYKHYNQILIDKGLIGVWKERRAIKNEISSLNFNMLDKRHKTLSEKALHNSIPHLILFKDILIKIKYTVELLTMIRVILSLISNIAFIPIFILAIWILIGKVYIIFSVLFTSTLVSAYLTNHYDYISKTADFLSRVKEALKGISVNLHNWLFNDDLISKTEMVKAIDKIESNSVPMSKAASYFGYAHDYALHTLGSLTQYINWSYAGYTGASLLVLTTSCLIYTGTINPTSIYNGVKVIGSAVWGFMSYFGFDDSNNPKDPGNSGNIGGGASVGPSMSEAVSDSSKPSRPYALQPTVRQAEIDEEAIKEAWLSTLSNADKGKAREALSQLSMDLPHLGSNKPAAINVGLSKTIDFPLSSATGQWSTIFRDKPSSVPLIEVTPPSPTGSVDSNITIKAAGEVSEGWEYPNLVIYPPINNNNNPPLSSPYPLSHWAIGCAGRADSFRSGACGAGGLSSTN